jgi:hypothetical protein
MANRIDNLHRKRTLLKTAKGSGTHLLGIASRKPRRSEGCATRPFLQRLFLFYALTSLARTPDSTTTRRHAVPRLTATQIRTISLLEFCFACQCELPFFARASRLVGMGLIRNMGLTFTVDRDAGGTTGQIKGIITIDRTDFGLGAGVKFVTIAHRVDLTIDFRAERVGPPLAFKH